MITMFLMIGGIAAAWLGYHADNAREVYRKSFFINGFLIAVYLAFVTMFAEIAIPALGVRLKDVRYGLSVIMFALALSDLLVYRNESVRLYIRDFIKRSR